MAFLDENGLAYLVSRLSFGSDPTPQPPDEEETFRWFSPNMTSNDTPAPYAVTASSSEPAYGSTGAYGAFDGNLNTFWGNGYNDAERSLTFDFGKKVKIAGFSMTGRNDAVETARQLPIAFDFYVSLDGKKFELVMSKTDIPPATVAGEQQEYLFSARDAKYIKIADMRSAYKGGEQYCGIAEMKFYIHDAASVSEKAIGTWNGKTLYRSSTVNFYTPLTLFSYAPILYISGIDETVFAHMAITNKETGKVYFVPWLPDVGACHMAMDPTTESYQFYNTSDNYACAPCSLTAYYTKKSEGD